MRVGADIYIGGDFRVASNGPANYVAKWDGTAWRSLGTGPANGMNGRVNALAVAPNGDVYAGGDFTQAVGIAANRVARWDGMAWSPLGTGVAIGSMFPSGIYAVAVAANGDVYVGGIFAQAGGIAANGAAKWDGTAWSPLGTSTNGFVQALTFGVNGKLYAGGSFSATGDGSKVMVNFGIYDPSILLATATAQTTPAAQLFPNPAHGTATLRLPAGTACQLLTLSEALGRTVRQYPAPASAEAVLDLRGLPAGTYLVRCGQVTQRLVVE